MANRGTAGDPTRPIPIPPESDGEQSPVWGATVISRSTPELVAWSAIGSVLACAASLLFHVGDFGPATAAPLGATLFAALARLGVFSRYKSERQRQLASELRGLRRMFALGLLTSVEYQKQRAAVIKKLARADEEHPRRERRRIRHRSR
jgi:hypothetical protein